MKLFFAISVSVLLWSCTKKVGKVPLETNSTSTSPIVAPIASTCVYTYTSIVSYSATISTIFKQNCVSCHNSPGAGGINLDSYKSCSDFSKSGQLIPVVVYNPNDVQMPPPPQQRLDSCQIRALSAWIEQGCLNN